MRPRENWSKEENEVAKKARAAKWKTVFFKGIALYNEYAGGKECSAPKVYIDLNANQSTHRF